MKRLLFIISLAIACTGSGYSPTVKERLDKFLDKEASTRVSMGAIAIIQHGKLVYQKGFGWADYKKGIKNDSLTLFPLGSTTPKYLAALAFRQITQSENPGSSNKKLLKFPSKLLKQLKSIANGDENYDKLISIIQKNSGKKVEDLFEEVFSGQLNLKNTYLSYKTPNSGLVAKNYSDVIGLIEKDRPDGPLVYSTAADLALFAELIYKGEVFNKSLVDTFQNATWGFPDNYMFQNAVPDVLDSLIGFGFGGFGSENLTLYIPSEDILIALICNKPIESDWLLFELYEIYKRNDKAVGNKVDTGEIEEFEEVDREFTYLQRKKMDALQKMDMLGEFYCEELGYELILSKSKSYLSVSTRSQGRYREFSLAYKKTDFWASPELNITFHPTEKKMLVRVNATRKEYWFSKKE